MDERKKQRFSFLLVLGADAQCCGRRERTDGSLVGCAGEEEAQRLWLDIHTCLFATEVIHFWSWDLDASRRRSPYPDGRLIGSWQLSHCVSTIWET